MKVASRALLYRLHCAVAWPAAPPVINCGNDHVAISEFHHSQGGVSVHRDVCDDLGRVE